MRQTKSMRFRELLPIILELENSKLHLQDGIIEILKQEHGLDINLNTYRNYLFRYAPKDENLISEPPVATSKNIQQNTKIEPNEMPLKTSSEVGENFKPSQDAVNGNDDEIDIEAIRQLEAELASDKASILKPKSVLRKE